MTIYNQNSETIGRFKNVLTNADALYRSYNAVEITFDQHFANKVTAFGGVTFGASKGCYAFSTNPNTNINNCGYDPLDSPTLANLSLVYLMPGGVSLSGHLRHATGQPLTYTYTFTRTQVPNLNQVNQAVNVTAPGDVRKPDVNLLDIRVAKEFRASGRLKIEPMVDSYNLTNNNATVTQVTVVGPNLGKVSEAVDARLVRFGVRVTF